MKILAKCVGVVAPLALLHRSGPVRASWPTHHYEKEKTTVTMRKRKLSYPTSIHPTAYMACILKAIIN